MQLTIVNCNGLSSWLRIFNKMSCNNFTGFIFPLLVISILHFASYADGFLFFPRNSAIGLLAALALPVDLPNRNVYMAFNFESNYALPTNDSYNEWIDRWDLDEHFLGIGNSVTPINARNDGALEDERSTRSARPRPPLLTRHHFYRGVVHYFGQFGLNGSACLLRTICEVSESPLDMHNGLLGSLFKILFMPDTSSAESALQHMNEGFHKASWLGTQGLGCHDYAVDCAYSLLDLVSITL